MSGLDGWRILAHERRQRRLERERRQLFDTERRSSTAAEWCVAIVATSMLIGAVLLVVHIVASEVGVL